MSWLNKNVNATKERERLKKDLINAGTQMEKTGSKIVQKWKKVVDRLLNDVGEAYWGRTWRIKNYGVESSPTKKQNADFLPSGFETRYSYHWDLMGSSKEHPAGKYQMLYFRIYLLGPETVNPHNSFAWEKISNQRAREEIEYLRNLGEDDFEFSVPKHGTAPLSGNNLKTILGQLFEAGPNCIEDRPNFPS